MLQTIVDVLEQYKRMVGRKHSIVASLKGTKKYSADTQMKLQNDYNIAEVCIEYLCNEHGCTRKSKSYKLGGKQQ